MFCIIIMFSTYLSPLEIKINLVKISQPKLPVRILGLLSRHLSRILYFSQLPHLESLRSAVCINKHSNLDLRAQTP